MNESSNDCPRVQSIFIHVHPWVLTKHCLLRFLQEMDFGTIMCWADNNVGQQKEPCVFHLIAAGKPEAPTNCTVVNQTSDSLEVYCIEGELYGPHRAHTYTYIYVKLPANLLPFFIRFGSVAFFFPFCFYNCWWANQWPKKALVNGRGGPKEVGGASGSGHVLRLPLQHEHECARAVTCICWVSCNAFQTHLKYMSNLSALWQPSTSMSIHSYRYRFVFPHTHTYIHTIVKHSQLPFVMQTQIIKTQWKHKTRKETLRRVREIMFLKFQFQFKICSNK